MDEIQFLKQEYPEMNGRIDDKCNLTWNNILRLLSKYNEIIQSHNNHTKSNINDKKCPVCEGKGWYYTNIWDGAVRRARSCDCKINQ